MAGVLEELVERCLEPSQDVVLLLISSSLLSYTLGRLLARHADLVKQNVVDCTVSLLFNIRLALQNVDIANTVCFARPIQCEHLLDELALDKCVHVENFVEVREIV